VLLCLFAKKIKLLSIGMVQISTFYVTIEGLHRFGRPHCTEIKLKPTVLAVLASKCLKNVSNINQLHCLIQKEKA
jgi:hypothetical protein